MPCVTFSLTLPRWVGTDRTRSRGGRTSASIATAGYSLVLGGGYGRARSTTATSQDKSRTSSTRAWRKPRTSVSRTCTSGAAASLSILPTASGCCAGPQVSSSSPPSTRSRGWHRGQRTQGRCACRTRMSLLLLLRNQHG